MTEVIIKRDKEMKASGYSVTINGIELPMKKSVTVEYPKNGYPVITIVMIATKIPGSEVKIIE